MLDVVVVKAGVVGGLVELNAGPSWRFGLLGDIEGLSNAPIVSMLELEVVLGFGSGMSWMRPVGGKQGDERSDFENEDVGCDEI